MTKIAPFDIVDHLDNEEVIAEYLTVALEDQSCHVSCGRTQCGSCPRHDPTREGFRFGPRKPLQGARPGREAKV